MGAALVAAGAGAAVVAAGAGAVVVVLPLELLPEVVPLEVEPVVLPVLVLVEVLELLELLLLEDEPAVVLPDPDELVPEVVVPAPASVVPVVVEPDVPVPAAAWAAAVASVPLIPMVVELKVLPVCAAAPMEYETPSTPRPTTVTAFLVEVLTRQTPLREFGARVCLPCADSSLRSWSRRRVRK